MSTIVRLLPRRAVRRAAQRSRSRTPCPLDVVYAQAGGEPPLAAPVAADGRKIGDIVEILPLV